MSEEPERLLTVDEAAAYFHVHRNTVMLWIRQGRLAAFRPGIRHWRIPARAVYTFGMQRGDAPPAVVNGEG